MNSKPVVVVVPDHGEPFASAVWPPGYSQSFGPTLGTGCKFSPVSICIGSKSRMLEMGLHCLLTTTCMPVGSQLASLLAKETDNLVT